MALVELNTSRDMPYISSYAALMVKLGPDLTVLLVDLRCSWLQTETCYSCRTVRLVRIKHLSLRISQLESKQLAIRMACSPQSVQCFQEEFQRNSFDEFTPHQLPVTSSQFSASTQISLNYVHNTTEWTSHSPLQCCFALCALGCAGCLLQRPGVKC